MYAATPFWVFFWGGHHSFLEDVSITLIDKTDQANLLQRENYWRSTLKTMTQWVLYIEDCSWNSVLLYSYHWICMDCNNNLIYGKNLGTVYYCYYFHHYYCCCRFCYSVVFVVAVSVIVLVFFFSLLLVLV